MAYTKQYKISFGCTANLGSTDYVVEVDTKGDTLSQEEYTTIETSLKDMVGHLNKAMEQGQSGWTDQHRWSLTAL